MADVEPFAEFPPKERRMLRRALKLRTYADLIGECEGNDFFTKLLAFTMQELMIEDEDLCDLEQHRQKLIEFVKRLHGHRDTMLGCPWTRFPRDLGYHGHLANMTAGELKVFMALLCLVDSRTLVTCASVETISTMAGLAWKYTSHQLTSLKKKGYIDRWSKKPEVQNDPWHYIWFARINVDAFCERSKDEENLRQHAVVPRHC